jgi:hypothetical protein
MGCPGCLISERELQQLMETVEKDGKAYAVEHQKLVVIYLDDERRPRFMEHGAAKSAGIIPIKHISHLQ